MKVCPKCSHQYDDDNLNFCLSDGELLMKMSAEDADATPTVYMDAPRVTNQNWEPPNPLATDPQQNQQIYQQPYSAPQQFSAGASKDKTLATVALVTGILSLLLMCCYLGIPLGAGALITGYLGMTKANSDPNAYGGRELAIVGMVLGGISFVLSAIFIFFGILGSILGG